MTTDDSRETRAVRAALESDTQHGAVIPPVYLTSNFSFEGFGQPRPYDYTRTGNPTRDALAGALAELEGGAGATVTSSGMAAVTLACQLLDPGDLVVGPQDCYGGTFRLFNGLSARGVFETRLVDQANESEVSQAIAAGAKMLWVESPTNPLLRIMDLARLRELAKDSPYIDATGMWVLLYVHIFFSVTTVIIWAATTFLALKWFSPVPEPNRFSPLHRRLAWISVVDMILTVVTGLLVYYYGFMAG